MVATGLIVCGGGATLAAVVVGLYFFFRDREK